MDNELRNGTAFRFTPQSLGDSLGLACIESVCLCQCSDRNNCGPDLATVLSSDTIYTASSAEACIYLLTEHYVQTLQNNSASIPRLGRNERICRPGLTTALARGSELRS